MKAIKRELKDWEHQFVRIHGRKPEKKDIAADAVIASKYKCYAKMKLMEARGDSSPSARVDPVAGGATAEKELSVGAGTNKEFNASSKAKPTKRSDKSKDAVDSVFEKAAALKRGSAGSNQTIYEEDEEAVEARKLFSEVGYDEVSEQRAPFLPQRSSATLFETPVRNTVSPPASQLAASFLRRSTIPSGPVATDERVQSEAERLKRLEQELLQKEGQKTKLYTLTAATEEDDYSNFSSGNVVPTRLHTMNPDVQAFMNRRNQLETQQTRPPAIVRGPIRAQATERDSSDEAEDVAALVALRPGSVVKTSGSTSSSGYYREAMSLPVPPPPKIISLDEVEEETEDNEVVHAFGKVAVQGKPVKKLFVVNEDASKETKEAEGISRIPRNSFFQDEIEVEVDPVMEFHKEPSGMKVTADNEKKEARQKEEIVLEKPKEVDELKGKEISPKEVSIIANSSIANPRPFSRLPEGIVLRCRLTRKKTLWDKVHPTLYLYNEVDDKFLLAARKMITSKSVHYLISTSMDDLSKDSTHYVAKLKANFARTNFILYDARFYNKNSTGKGLKELACVSYSKTVLPREMKVAILSPNIPEGSEHASRDIMADIKSMNAEKLVFLKNKTPRWNETTQSHCLNFGGRVTQPSIKNFQLISDDSDTIVLQFGRCGPDIFSMDARYPMTPIEAFAVAISTFDAYDSA